MGKLLHTPVLLSPYTLGDLQLKNRIVMAPLTRTRADHQGYGAPGIYSEEQRAGWERITDRVHRAGGLIFVQLWHQGAVSHRSLYADGRMPLGPSAVNPEQLIHVEGGRVMSETPGEMSLQDIEQAVKDFRHAAQVARDAGFDGIQIQGGFVYLFQQFLHEVTNRRTDQYGGSMENRARMRRWPHRAGKPGGRHRLAFPLRRNPSSWPAFYLPASNGRERPIDLRRVG